MRFIYSYLAAVLLIQGCGGSGNETNDSALIKEKESPLVNLDSEYNENRNAYFGDLHVHTMYSFDAFIFGTTASPDEAYGFAMGEALRHPGGFDMQLKVPLDFYAVSDHGFYLGALRAMADPASSLSRHELAQGMDDLGGAANRPPHSPIGGNHMRRQSYFPRPQDPGL